MDLNKDCIRDVLLYIKKYCIYEKTNFGTKLHEVTLDELCKSEKCSKYGIETIYYTINKLNEYGLIKFGKVKYSSNIDKTFQNLHINDITPRGHEFVDNVGSDKVWQKIKTAIDNSDLEDCSFEMYYEYIYNEVRKQLN